MMFVFSCGSFLMALCVISVNINGLRDADKRLSFFQWLSHLCPAVVCLQETHVISPTKLSSWVSGYGYLCAGSFGSHRSCGVDILYRPVPLCCLSLMAVSYWLSLVSLTPSFVLLVQIITLSVIPFFISVWIILILPFLPFCVKPSIPFSTVSLFVVGPAPSILLVRYFSFVIVCFS